MPILSIKIPQLGEGLQETLLVEFLKKPGDQVHRDQPIYVMETDKAVTEVESPYAGTLLEWVVEPGTVVKIGSVIGHLDALENVNDGGLAAPPEDATSSGAGGEIHVPQSVVPGTSNAKVLIPPKTRAYLREHGLLDSANEIPHSGKKLMPEDVDAYLLQKRLGSPPSRDYAIESLPNSQLILNYRLAQSAKACIPVTIMTDIDWSALENSRQQVGSPGGPTDFAMVCWAVVQAMKKHHKFRSVISADGKSLQVFPDVSLGIAVALPSDEMVIAVIHKADSLSANDFFEMYQTRVELARKGSDQADEATTINVSNIGIGGMRVGIPAIVAPAAATLAIGQTFAHPVPHGDSFRFKTKATATLCFDHRIINGIGAANFMNDIKGNIESYEI